MDSFGKKPQKIEIKQKYKIKIEIRFKRNRPTLFALHRHPLEPCAVSNLFPSFCFCCLLAHRHQFRPPPLPLLPLLPLCLPLSTTPVTLLATGASLVSSHAPCYVAVVSDAASVSGCLLKWPPWGWTALRRRGVEANAGACAIVATKSRCFFLL